MSNKSSGSSSNYYFGDVHEHHYHNASKSGNDGAILKQVNQLQDELRRQAIITTGVMDYPVDLDQAINPVNLQIKSDIRKPLSVAGDGQYRRRSEMERLFTIKSRSVDLDQLFSYASELAEQEATIKCRNPEARKAWSETNSNIVGAIGHAGMGKTTLAKMLAQNVLQQTVLSDTEFVFYIPLRLVNFKKQMSFVQFLLAGSNCHWQSGSANDKFLLDVLEKSKVLFFFDGLDEADFDKASRTSVTSSDDLATADVFLKNILAGKLLQKSKKLVTSRPNSMYNLHPDYRPHCLVEIIGLSKVSQDDLCDQICGQLSSQVKEKLYQHPELSAYSHIPIYCIMTIACISENLKHNTGYEIISMTDVLLHVLLKYMRTDHLRSSTCDLSKLASLAWSGLLTRTVFYSDEDLKAANVNKADIQAFLNTYIDDTSSLRFKVMEVDKTCSFVHQIWQEFLGACYVMFFMPVDELESCLDDMLKSQRSVVMRFMYGFCNQQLFVKARKVFSGISVDSWETKQDLLEQLAVSQAKSISTSQNEKQVFCRVCRWAWESRNDKIAKSVATNLPECICLFDTLTPNEEKAIYSVLKIDNTLTILKMGKNPKAYRALRCTESAFDKFLNDVSPIVVADRIKVPLINLFQTVITTTTIHAMQPFLSQLSQLVLLECGLKCAEAACLADLLNNQNAMLDILDLSVNEIGCEGVAAISNTVSQVKALYLRNCGIQDAGTKALATKMSDHQNMVENLSLAFNNIGNIGAAAVASNLGKLQCLDLHDCGITADGMCAVANGLNACEKSDTKSVVKALACFLGYENHVQEAHDLDMILERCSFGFMSAHMDKFSNYVVNGSCAVIRRGVIGDWKNYMSEEQAKIIDNKCKKYGIDHLWKKYGDLL